MDVGWHANVPIGNPGMERGSQLEENRSHQKPVWEQMRKMMQNLCSFMFKDKKEDVHGM